MVATTLKTICGAAILILLHIPALANDVVSDARTGIPRRPQEARANSPALPHDLTVPVEYYTLKNGLKVVLSRDTTAPIAVVVVDYNIGGRLEPRGRGGFAHLFEHLMYQGTANLPKGEFARLVQSNGGVVNGSTGFDFTTYFSVIPANILRTVLWAEADRMKGLDLTQANLANQQAVVENELNVRVFNQPYGGFPDLIMPQYVYRKWNNAHLAIGTVAQIQAATLGNAKAFFRRYYAPNNAVLVVSGDFDPAQARALIEAYFASIPRRSLPAKPSLGEPSQRREISATHTDPLAPRPAVAFAYRMPPRESPEFWAMALIDELLAQGSNSLLYQALVTGGVTDSITSNLDVLQLFGFEGPQLYIVSLFPDASKNTHEVMAAADRVIGSLRSTPVSAAALARARLKMRADFYRGLEQDDGFGKAHLLALFALFDNDPARINQVIDRFQQVTPALIEKTAQEYLLPSERTVLTIQPGGRSAKSPRPASDGGS